MSKRFEEDNQITSDDLQIDLKDIFQIFLRNKLLIVFITILSLIISTWKANSTKKTWQGEFQIVLEKEKSDSIQNPVFSNLIGLNQNSLSLQTEVATLKSPSVLMDVFQFVKDYKTSLDKKKYEFKV